MAKTSSSAVKQNQGLETGLVDPVVDVRTDGFLLSGRLLIPENPVGLAVLANGTGADIPERFEELASHLRRHVSDAVADVR